jgi:hypothetical protein
MALLNCWLSRVFYLPAKHLGINQLHPMLTRMRDRGMKFWRYSIRTWYSTFQRRSEPVCFIQSSRFPNSVTSGLIRTGMG